MNESNKLNKFLTLKEKADNGDANAQLKVGEMYESGTDVQQSYANAFKYYMLASEQGINEAYNYIGLLYQDGLGVEKNFNEAAKYFKKAADNGYKHANNNLISFQVISVSLHDWIALHNVKIIVVIKIISCT